MFSDEQLFNVVRKILNNILNFIFYFWFQIKSENVCQEFTTVPVQLIGTYRKASINFRIGDEFNFEVCNKEEAVLGHKKKLSPSQRKRSCDEK